MELMVIILVLVVGLGVTVLGSVYRGGRSMTGRRGEDGDSASADLDSNSGSNGHSGWFWSGGPDGGDSGGDGGGGGGDGD